MLTFTGLSPMRSSLQACNGRVKTSRFPQTKRSRISSLRLTGSTRRGTKKIGGQLVSKPQRRSKLERLRESNSVDRTTLADHLFAETLSAPLRGSSGFCESTRVAYEATGSSHVRLRADSVKSRVSCIESDLEWAIETVENEYARRGKEFNRGALMATPHRIVSVLSSHARCLLQSAGSEMILRLNRAEPGREILRWRFVSLALPPGILIAATARAQFVPPASLRLLDRSIAPDQPVAHHHVHHAATMSFEELWASLRFRALLRPTDLAASVCDSRAFCPGLHNGVCFGGRTPADRRRAKKYWVERRIHMMQWSDLIRQAFIAGRVLHRHSHHRDPLDKCRDGDCKRVLDTTLQPFLAGRTKPYSETGTPYPWPDELITLARRSRDREGSGLFLPSRADLMRRETADEHSLLVRAFVYLQPELAESNDPLYERLFLQYLRVKVAVFGLLVHPPEEKGLKDFLDHFLQIKVYAPESDTIRPRVPMEPGLQVESTEYRIAPDAWFHICRRYDSGIEEKGRGPAGLTAAGWLVHFKRSSQRGNLPLYSSEIRKMESEADQIMRDLTATPVRLRILRGIDICGVEEAQPLWVSANTLRRVRAHSRVVAASRPELFLNPLRLTLHAGEDFGWLTSGVRAVAEPFHWNLLERGDRIGHGIAVTFDPEEWWKKRSGDPVALKRFARLLDLAFLAEYTKGRDPCPDQDAWLGHQIQNVVHSIWPSAKKMGHPSEWFVEEARKLWRALGGRLIHELLQRPSWPNRDDTNHEAWLHSYLWCRSTQERAEEDIPLTVGDDRQGLKLASSRTECDLLVKARLRVIREVAALQICIESNPSSNFLVGGLPGIAAQDFLQQRPTRQAVRGEDTLTWTISTDDPITFSTTLADEYAYAWAGMVLRPEQPNDPSYARALLDEAAATSMRMRFTNTSKTRPRRDGRA
jgi:adenosine deaminase